MLGRGSNVSRRCMLLLNCALLVLLQLVQKDWRECGLMLRLRRVELRLVVSGAVPPVRRDDLVRTGVVVMRLLRDLRLSEAVRDGVSLLLNCSRERTHRRMSRIAKRRLGMRLVGFLSVLILLLMLLLLLLELKLPRSLLLRLLLLQRRRLLDRRQQIAHRD